MRMIFKVSYYVRSNYENKQGKSPLMIRIFLNGEMLNVGSSGIYIDKKLWNNSTNRVKGRGSESLNLNAQLDNISNSLQMIFKKHEFDEDLTLDKIKSIFLGKNKVKTTFVEFYDKYLEDIKAQVGAGKSIALYHKVTTKKRNAERYSDRIELQGFQSCFRLFVKPSQSPLKPNQDAATLLVRNHARNGDKRTRITKQGVKD